ncbi:MAG: CBS domain-containing protein [Dehalococcoidia bacterium]|nr:CBS domain-containing protein [Dehalococcoidia bacterium]
MGSTTFILTTVILILSAALLVLIAAAEAGVTALSRSRVRSGQSNGLGTLIRNYVRQRQRVLRTLGAGSTIAIVAWTAALTFALLDNTEVTPAGLAVAAGASALGAALLRQTARAVVLLNPEAAGPRLARMIQVLQLAFTPFAWVANAPVDLLLRAIGGQSAEEVDTSEELAALLDVAGDEDEASLAEERRMMRGVLDLSQQTVRELMTPRTDLTAVSTESSVGDVMRVITQSGFSRIPLYEDSLDRIIGVVYAKDLLAFFQSGNVRPELTQIARPPYFVPETKRANELLADMRREQVHMAVAVDEYGGTAGVVTVEDLLEEIVGEITDEYDVDEVDVQRISDDEAIVDARMTIDELNDLFASEIHSDDFDTVGGLIFTLLGRLAVPGDEVRTSDNEDHDDDEALELRVLSILGRRIKKVRVIRAREEARIERVDEPAEAL